MREQVAHYDRQDEDRPDHTCRWLCRIIIEDERRQSSIDAHVQGKLLPKPPKQPTATEKGGSDPNANDPLFLAAAAGKEGATAHHRAHQSPARTPRRAMAREQTGHRVGEKVAPHPAGRARANPRPMLQIKFA